MWREALKRAWDLGKITQWEPGNRHGFAHHLLLAVRLGSIHLSSCTSNAEEMKASRTGEGWALPPVPFTLGLSALNPKREAAAQHCHGGLWGETACKVLVPSSLGRVAEACQKHRSANLALLGPIVVPAESQISRSLLVLTENWMLHPVFGYFPIHSIYSRHAAPFPTSPIWRLKQPHGLLPLFLLWAEEKCYIFLRNLRAVITPTCLWCKCKADRQRVNLSSHYSP